MTSREAAIVAFGADAVRTYELVKGFYTRYGSALEHVFAAKVDGRVGSRGEPDVITWLGGWEFCAAENTKNADGDAAQLAKVGRGQIVQVTGKLRPGRISGEDFLRQHGIPNPNRVIGELQIAALELAKTKAAEHIQLSFAHG